MWALLISRLTDPPGVYFDRRQFDGGSIGIGRSAKTCDIVLPNDDGLISRTHCTISAVGFDLFVTDSSTNGVALNDPAARIVPNQPVPIRVRDRLIVHAFVITVVTAAEGASAGLSVAGPAGLDIPDAGAAVLSDVWGAGAPDPFWQPAGGGMGGMGSDGIGGGDIFGDGGGDDGLVHDFLSGGNAFFDQPAQGQDMAHHPADFRFSDGMGEAFSRPIMAAPPAPSADMGIPEDWLSDLVAPAGNSAPPPRAILPASPPPRYEPPRTPVPPAGVPFAPLPDHDLFGGGGTDGGFGGGFDPFADTGPVFGDTPAAPIPDAAPVPPYQPPKPSPPPVDVAAAPAASTGMPDWSQFYEGAGLNPQDLPLAPDALFKLGQMYRQMVLGMCDILQDRAAFKDEFRVERTQLSIGRNNPLKHLPAIEVAKVLLGKPLPGFMDMEESLRTSLEDLKKHQLAMLAGVQNALLVVFDRLAPAEIERFAGKVENQKRGLLGRREPDRWAVYMTVFEALRRDATGNANGVMSVAFREGYETFMKSVR